MKVEAIKVSILKRTLSAWRQGKTIPTDLLNLDILRTYGHAQKIENDHNLQGHLLTLTENLLAEQRLAAGISPIPVRDKNDLLQQLKSDFTANYPKLEVWSALYHRFFSPITLEVQELAQAIPGERVASEKLFQRRTSSGLKMLVDLLQKEELAAHAQFKNKPYRLRRHLPSPDYAQLFGVDPLLNRLNSWLSDSHLRPFISIEGIGGIGKTAVARATATYQANLPDWHDIIWISARQYNLNLASGQMHTISNSALTFADIARELTVQLGQKQLAGLDPDDKLKRLQTTLKAAPHLIIIDNLETLEDIDTLIPHLEPLSSPSQFILTSRHTMSRFPFVHCLPVPALSYEDSTALVQSEIHRHPHPFALTPTIMKQIYELVGGLPLALKLLAAQLGKFPPDYLLSQLNQATPHDTYTYIYHLTWQRLNRPARRLLTQLIDIPPDGIDIHALREHFVLTNDELTQGLAQLIDTCLVEPAGTAQNPLYKLHRLTTTFLQTEIIDTWDGD